MPFQSQAQRKFLHAKHPDIADRWEKKYPPKGALPERKGKPPKRKKKKGSKGEPSAAAMKAAGAMLKGGY